MKILISAFAFHPDLGSEPGVGWAWAAALTRAGHHATVITRSCYRTAVDARLASGDVHNLRCVYVDVPLVPYKIPFGGVYPYYYVWQWRAYAYAKTLPDIAEYSCVHHLTYSSYRTPFFLSLLPIPSIFGPVSGGEVTPLRLIGGLSTQGAVREYLRYFMNFLSAFNPLTILTWHRTTLCLITTPSTLRMMPPTYRRKARLSPAITTPDIAREPFKPSSKRRGCCRLLFVGRLLEWKGVHLALQALAVARTAVPDISLTIRGSGGAERHLRRLSSDLKLDSYIDWLSTPLSRDALLQTYQDYDIFIFPALHDPGGWVVLEALSTGTPVLALNLGGPGRMVDSTCGALVETTNRSQQDVVVALSDELRRFANMSGPELDSFRHAAMRRARAYKADVIVKRAYEFLAVLQSPSSEASTRR